MEPVYMNMQSYPHQDQMHYRPRCYSGMEARPPMSYGCWPWGGNYGYAPHGACHGCSNHAYMPAHCAWGSPYSHVPPHHCPGNYTHFPVQYMPPPPYKVMQHPRYEYEKSVPTEHHCCGYPTHHPPHQTEQRNVRIEEEEPERERRKNDSVVPLQFKNSPYPIVWLPPDYTEQGKVKNTESRKDASRDVKEREKGATVEQQPTFRKGWLPVDLSKVVASKQRGDGEENYHQDNGKRNSQVPLFWIPYKLDDTECENHKVKDVNEKPTLGSENRGNIGDQTASRAKGIPVKEVEQEVGKGSSIIQEKGRDASVRDRTDNGEKKIDNVEKVSPTEGSKRKSPSPPKSSKLPPVCLRVDPLPRKKSANAKSRSPSPPGDKQKQEVKSNEVRKAHSPGNEEQVKEDKGTKTIAVVDGIASPVKSMTVNVETTGKLPAKSQDDVSMKQAEEKPEEHIAQKHTACDAVTKGQSEDIVSASGDNEGSFRAEGNKTDAVKKCRELSKEEAAVISQSAYRRFDVCRWKPIEKLKQIAKVREQIADVKHLIQELELSSDIQGRSKQKTIISETIMSLLLKLDTIQGLHPSIRDVRKSVVRELLSLQEQLDSLMNDRPENLRAQEVIMRRDYEYASNKSENVMSSENCSEINPVVDLESQIDGGSNSEEANLIEEVASVKIGMEAAESSADEGVKSAQGATTKDENEKSSDVLENNETSIAKEDHEAIILGQGSELSSLQDESSRATGLAPTDHDILQSELEELPQGVLDDLCEAEGANHSAVEADSSIADQSKQIEGALIGSPSVQESHYGIANEENHQTMEAHEASNLPLNAVEPGAKETDIGGSLNNCKLDDKLEGEVDNSSGDARSEPNECTAQQLENFTANMIEPSDERELPTAGACIGNSTTYDNLHENSGVTDSTMEEEPQESPTEKEMSSQLLQEVDLEKTSLINEHANTCNAVDMDGVASAAEAKPNDGNNISNAKQGTAVDINHSGGGVSEEILPQITEACQPEIEGAADVPPEMEVVSKQGEECNTEHPTPNEATEKQGLEDAAEHEENTADPATVQVSPARDDRRESNRKLIEENERLREMMEKLIKSGQEQLTAISSLSGRVKDMEKRLSRKKKLRVKQLKAPRSSCITKFDGSGGEKTIGVTM